MGDPGDDPFICRNVSNLTQTDHDYSRCSSSGHLEQAVNYRKTEVRGVALISAAGRSL